ncbi:MAG: zinc ribbon domain-containing protein, partial [Labilithrix sp.]|nr:zinc ribbon domain-containing protein [Labilithrix sp.]
MSHRWSVMTCTTCGRENPPHLTFCQECGQRLGPRIAPPTPPIGLGGDGAQEPPPPQASSRLATSLGAGPSPAAGLLSSPAAAPAVSLGAPRRCRVCDTPNGPNLRYCTSCGSTLEPAPVAAPAPSP